MTTEDRARQEAAAEALAFSPLAQEDTHTIGLDAPTDVPNRYGSGTIAVFEATITYHRGEDGSRSVTACVKGTWRRGDGELTDAPLDQEYGNGPGADWPDWLAGLAWYYHPEPRRLPDAIPDRAPVRRTYVS